MDTKTKIQSRTRVGFGTTPESVDGVHAQAVPLPLPFEDGADEAVPFVLTAAAHREVLGRSVPRLAPVPDRSEGSGAAVGPVPSAQTAAASDDEAPDTRRVQARALLRSGMPVTTIAAALGVDVSAVEQWTADLEDELARRRRAAARRRPAPARTSPGRDGRRSEAAVGHATLAPQLVPGLALALAEVDDDGVALVHHDVGPVAILLGAVRARLEVPAGRIRVAVRLAPDVPTDRTRAILAEQLGVEATTIVIGRAGLGSSRPLELRVDVRDADAARLVRGWQDGAPLDDADAADGTTDGPADGTGLRGWDSNPQTFRLTADCSAN
jgi:hypothetical protein